MRLLLAAGLALVSHAAEPKFVAPLPAPSQIDVRKNVAYKKVNGSDLVMDVYRPAKRTKNEKLPVIVFMNGFGGQSQREHPQYKGWGALAAGNGFIAINPDTHTEGIEEDFDSLAAYIRDHAAELNADPDRIGLYACSGHVSKSFAMIEDPKRTTIKAAAIYYGVGSVPAWRFDLPVLYVRAGLDRPGMNKILDAIAAEANAANAPVTLVNYAGGHHGFEIIDDNETTRDVIAQTLRFFKTTLTPAYQSALKASVPTAAAVGAVGRGDYETAVRLYAPLAAANPGDSRLQLSYGEALLGAKRYAEATTQFDKLRGNRNLGPRDLGLPAARAAAQSGDTTKALEWLSTIPARFMPNDVARDPAFRTLEGDPKFLAVLNRPKN